MFNRNEEDRIMAEIRRQNSERIWNERLNAVGNFVVENGPKLIGGIAILGAGFSAVSDLVSSVNHAQQKHFDRSKRTQFYDRSTGTYVKLKRQLTSSDLQKVNVLKSKGMKTAEALNKLGLIK